MYEVHHMYVCVEHSRLRGVDITQMLFQDKVMFHLCRNGIVCKSSAEKISKYRPVNFLTASIMGEKIVKLHFIIFDVTLSSVHDRIICFALPTFIFSTNSIFAH